MGESLHCQNSVWEAGNLPGFKDDADVIFLMHIERELFLSDLVTQCAKLKVVTKGHSFHAHGEPDVPRKTYLT